ncbi:hypothetical protein HPB51_010498 [Rhipicephalus microplus]|uniref:Serpin domain-containing protein n=1 Tax=Rhipicephalus microplus TaxID=6941 RepID=A0A9J6E0P7_RHIMP|nr:hypothetical protein HPB51_010498 [Rhipicephalus microplus]
MGVPKACASEVLCKYWLRFKQQRQLLTDAAGRVTAASLVCMVSVVDFRGSWKQAFDDRTTTRELFHELHSRSTSVIMVHQTGRFRFARCPDLSAMVVELPYEKPVQVPISAASVSLPGVCTPASGCVTPAM